MNCPRGDHGLVERVIAVHNAVGFQISQWHCLQCGWRDDAWRDEQNCHHREAQRRVMRGWHEHHVDDGERAMTLALYSQGVGEEGQMGRTWSVEARLNLQNKRRKEKGLAPLTIEQYQATLNGQDVDTFVPGRFVAAGAPHILIPSEVSFNIGRTVKDWANFIAIWKRQYEQFHLARAFTKTDEDTTVTAVLAPLPTELKDETLK